MVDTGRALLLVEARSGATVAGDFFDGLNATRERLSEFDRSQPIESVVVYGGDRTMTVHDTTVVPWTDVPAVNWGD